MTNHLGNLLAASYAEHPGFKFDQPVMDIEDASLAEFGRAYDIARTFPRGLTGRQLTACRRACEQSMGRVFEQLEAQAADHLERLFLAELRSESARVLREEYEHFAETRRGARAALDQPAVQQAALQLQANRCFVGALSAGTAREILEVGSATVDEFREHARMGHLTREDLMINVGPLAQGIASILNRDFRALGVLDAMSAYMNRPMIVTGVALELSVPQATWWRHAIDGSAPPQTLYAHFDESIGAPKAIVYLTDVSPSNGPTSYYPGAYEGLTLNPLQEVIGRVIVNVGDDPKSPLARYYQKSYHQTMTTAPFRRHFMRLPPSLRFNSHFGWDVYRSSAAENALVQHERVLTGPAGTFVAFDGGCMVHRGGMVVEGERIALQVVLGQRSPYFRVRRRLRRLFA